MTLTHPHPGRGHLQLRSSSSGPPKRGPNEAGSPPSPRALLLQVAPACSAKLDASGAQNYGAVPRSGSNAAESKGQEAREGTGASDASARLSSSSSFVSPSRPSVPAQKGEEGKSNKEGKMEKVKAAGGESEKKSENEGKVKEKKKEGKEQEKPKQEQQQQKQESRPPLLSSFSSAPLTLASARSFSSLSSNFSFAPTSFSNFSVLPSSQPVFSADPVSPLSTASISRMTGSRFPSLPRPPHSNTQQRILELRERVLRIPVGPSTSLSASSSSSSSSSPSRTSGGGGARTPGRSRTLFQC